MPSAHVHPHNGTPTLFLNGEPVYAAMHWLAGGFDPDGSYQNDYAVREFARSGVHMNAVGIAPAWCGAVAPSTPDADLEEAGRLLRAVLAADPQALFHLRIYLESGSWFNERFPDECEVASDGSRLNASYASDVWHAHVLEYLDRLVHYLRAQGLYDCVIAYQVCPGICGEWVKNVTSMTPLTGDYSAPMQCRFRAWLRAKYSDDDALRRAWNDEHITLETALPPANAALLEARHMSFRDPASEQHAVDYLQNLADLVAERLIAQCRHVKDITGGDKLAGAFYGYILDQAWNDNYFGGAVDSSYSTIQRSGHLGLRTVLRAPEVDFLVSPYGYAFRGLGGDGLSMTASESARLHGKLYLYEEDSRLHNLFDANGRNFRPEHAVAIHQRCFGYAATHGFGIWWLADWPPRSYERQPQNEPGVFHPWLEKFMRIGRMNLELDNTPQSETAVIIDDESFLYESLRNDMNRAGVFYQRVFGLARFGAPHDLLLLDDYLDEALVHNRYKLLVFLNPWRLDAARRAKLQRRLHNSGVTAVFVHGAGYLNDAPALEHMTELTGIRFGKSDYPWPMRMHATDFTHEITRTLPQDFFWGTDSALGPVFHSVDPDARVIGQVVTAMGRCKPGFVVKQNDGWQAVWLASPGIPAAVLRGIARHAGVHLYSEAGDVLHASASLLNVHTVAGGARKFKLPRTVAIVRDLYDDRVLARHAAEFEDVLEPNSSRLYFFAEVDSNSK
jgi:hypothetical protein